MPENFEESLELFSLARMLFVCKVSSWSSKIRGDFVGIRVLGHVLAIRRIGLLAPFGKRSFERANLHAQRGCDCKT